MAVFFHQTENLMAKLGVLAPGSTRTRGRKSTIPGIQHSKRPWHGHSQALRIFGYELDAQFQGFPAKSEL
jgi:hypothetical protein